jgi:hypothetical protein
MTKPVTTTQTLARGRARHSRLHFLGRDVFNLRADRPLVAERGSRDRRNNLPKPVGKYSDMIPEVRLSYPVPSFSAA